jgi:hypothetical protein
VRKHFKAITASAKEQYKSNKFLFFVYFFLRLIVLGILVRSIWRGDYQSTFYCLLSLLLFCIPPFVEHRLKIDVPDTLEIIILFFIFSNEILGELASFFVNVPNWDTLMHTISGFLCAAIGFSLVDILNREDKFSFNLSPLYVAFAAFCFSMTVGVIWEFFEFSMDHFFGGDMQKDYVINTIRSVSLDPTKSNKVVTISGIKDVILVTDTGNISLGLGGYLDVGIIDTMKDLFVNFIGAVVFSFIGFFHVKSRGNGKFAKHFIPTRMSDSSCKEQKVDKEIDKEK